MHTGDGRNHNTAGGFSGKRWYDKDPVLSKAMSTLQKSDDKIQIQVALNLIKIVIEHKIELAEVQSLDDILSTVKEASEYDKSKADRWYDLNETVRAAILMLQQCPEDIQKKNRSRYGRISFPGH